MQQQDQKSMSYGEQINLLVSIGQIVGHPMTAWLRRFGWGCRYAGHQALMGLMFMWLWIGYIDNSPMVATGATVGTMIMYALHRFKESPNVHSRYPGFSRLCKKGGNDKRAKGLWEPLLLILLGVPVTPASGGLGTYLVLAGFGLAADHSYQWAWTMAEVRAMRDAHLRANYVRQVYEEEYPNG